MLSKMMSRSLALLRTAADGGASAGMAAFLHFAETDFCFHHDMFSSRRRPKSSNQPLRQRSAKSLVCERGRIDELEELREPLIMIPYTKKTAFVFCTGNENIPRKKL
jgi:hypothetical protein